MKKQTISFLAAAPFLLGAPLLSGEVFDLVDPLINSDSARIFQTKTASRPFGMVQLAPDTVLSKGGFWGGYSYGTPNVKGFGHVRDWRIAGLLVMPTVGGVAPTGPDSWNSDFSHETEVAQAGYHKLVLDRYDIEAEMTATARVAIHRWQFGKGGEADIMFDFLTPLIEANPVSATVTKTDDRGLEGVVTIGHGKEETPSYEIFFVATFDRPMDSLRAWQGKELGDVGSASGAGLVAYPRFRVEPGTTVTMKLAISYCSIPQARSNMDAELPGWDFAKVRADARDEWESMLSKIRIKGGTEAQRKKFYTDMWHVLLGRSTYSDANGKYPDRTGGSIVIRELPRRNIAGLAEVSASSSFSGEMQAANVNDGILAKSRGEWASKGESRPWVRLAWNKPVRINRVDLHDRMNKDDNARGGTLSFSDGTSIEVTGIPDDGEGKVVGFPAKTVEWVRFEASAGEGNNVGLSEFKVRGADEPPAFRMFNSDSLWWSQWNLNLVWGMAYPEILEEWVESSLQVYENDPKGRIPWGMVAGDHSWIMSGAQRTPLIARAIQMDLRNIDLAKAYKALIKNHSGSPFKEPAGNIQWLEEYERLGYVPFESVSFSAGTTLEHAYCDWVMAQVCEKMGDQPNRERFLKRSQSWKNIWNPETGFLMPRRQDGSWKEPFDPFEGDYQGYIEGNAWSYLWFATHDVMGLANLMGGRDAYADRLNEVFEKTVDENFLKIHSYLDYGNQPSCQVAHLFNYVGKPWLTQYWTREVNERAYGSVAYEKGLGVGDEDQGMMGGVSALMSMGLFSVRGATDVDPIYDITSPVFDEITIELDPRYYEGGEFTIRTTGNMEGNPYIQSASLNGEPLDRCWIRHGEFARGGLLQINLGPDPNMNWGTGSLPPSETPEAPAAGAQGKETSAIGKPNILIIYADDLGIGDVASYNPEGKIPTPNIDRLAGGGMRFTDAHSAGSVCSSSRYALLTGRYPWRNWNFALVGHWDKPRIKEGQATIATAALAEGYATACIGKWHLGWDWPMPPGTRHLFGDGNYDGEKNLTATDRHREVWRETFSKPIGGGPLDHGFGAFFGLDLPNWAPYCFIEGRHTVGIPSEFADPSIFGPDLANTQGPAIPGWKLEDVLPSLIGKACGYIKSERKEPFLLYLCLTSPHTPLAVQPEWKGKSGLSRYADFVMETDAAVGKVLDALDESGKAGDTLVIFSSDNGCYGPYQTELQQKGHFSSLIYRGSKGQFWEGGSRMPFIVRWPGRIAPGTTSPHLVNQSDLFATFAEIWGRKIASDEAPDSVSMLPLLLGSQRPVREHSTSEAFGKVTLRLGDWKYIAASEKEKQGEPLGLLYNLAEDPSETRNLAAEHPDKLREMKILLAEQVRRGRSTPGPNLANDSDLSNHPASTGG